MGFTFRARQVRVCVFVWVCVNQRVFSAVICLSLRLRGCENLSAIRSLLLSALISLLSLSTRWQSSGAPTRAAPALIKCFSLDNATQRYDTHTHTHKRNDPLQHAR
ncbi:hypothetical protein IRJ41_011718 [Triplophysa rosa]|uniref:Uncharacterized protein n=1 Tax=Triplophysa rosa TaxID=992332 RepID=A0A9W7T8I6_TRIRA|nr:hypothetical protein IRJ41_011718 [Triplophysa rosa]